MTGREGAGAGSDWMRYERAHVRLACCAFARRQVLAARDGVVAAVCDHFREGGPKARLLPRANFIALRHADGTYSRYVHIMPSGALVRVGQVRRRLSRSVPAVR